MREPLVRKAIEHDLEPLAQHRLGVLEFDAVILHLDGRGAAAKAHVDAPAAHLVDHGDFLDEAQRRIEGQGEDQRPETQVLRALRDGRHVHRRRGRHAQRRRMVLRDVVAVKAISVVGLDELHSRLEIIAQREVVPVEVIENAEIHSSRPLRSRFARPQPANWGNSASALSRSTPAITLVEKPCELSPSMVSFALE